MCYYMISQYAICGCFVFFKTRGQKTRIEMENFFSDADIPKLSENQVKLCEENLTEKDLYNSLKSMQSDKSPGNDGLTNEF